MRDRIVSWILDHLRAAVGGLGRLSYARVASAMTALVIGVSIALPSGFMLLLHNMESLTGDWRGSSRISLFLHMDVGEERAQDLATEIRSGFPVEGIELVSAEAALEEFRQLSDMDTALDLLDENPLPAMLVLRPAPGTGPEQLRRMVVELEAMSAVDQARLDLQWVQRLDAIMDLTRRGVWLVAAMLGISVVLVVGNTIRLAIENRREEIVIAKLIGATDAFIRRPFLYEGLWYGLAGGTLAVALVETGRALLATPAARLAALYGTESLLRGLGTGGIVAVLGAAAGLGLAGSWVAVGRHLAAIEPR